jgi:hypothetical protein
MLWAAISSRKISMKILSSTVSHIALSFSIYNCNEQYISNMITGSSNSWIHWLKVRQLTEKAHIKHMKTIKSLLCYYLQIDKSNHISYSTNKTSMWASSTTDHVMP